MDLPNKKQLAKEMITIFRTPEQYIILKSRCINNELLYHRCEEIHTILNDAKIII